MALFLGRSRRDCCREQIAHPFREDRPGLLVFVLEVAEHVPPRSSVRPRRSAHACSSSSPYHSLRRRRYAKGPGGSSSPSNGRSSVSATHQAARCEASRSIASIHEGCRNSNAYRKVGGRKPMNASI